VCVCVCVCGVCVECVCVYVVCVVCVCVCGVCVCFQSSAAKLLRTTFFWVITQRVVAIYYQRFRTI